MKRETRELLRAVVKSNDVLVHLAEDRLTGIEDAMAQIDHRSGGQSEQLARQAEQIDALVKNTEDLRTRLFAAMRDHYSRKVPE